MDFMNFVRDLFAAPPPAAEPAPGYGYGESQVGARPPFPRPFYGSDATGSDATVAGDLQTVAGNYGGFAEGFGNEALVAESDGLGWRPGGGGYGATN